MSFQIFHGVWTIAFFCLTIINTKTVLPNASCLLAGYLPALLMVGVVLAQKGGVNYPAEIDLGNPWEGIDGVDLL